jgi:hypothetical protein
VEGHHLEEVLGIAQKQVILVAEVSVEGGAAYAGAIEDVPHSDLFEWLLAHEIDQRVAECISGAANAAIWFADLLTR